MKKRALNLFFINMLLIVGLSSCFIEDLISDFYPSMNIDSTLESSFFHEDEGDTTTLVNNAFNALKDNNNESLLVSDDYFKNNDENKTSIIKNLYDLEYNETMTPASGNVKGLVLLVDFPDYPLINKSYNNPYPTYQSVASYYHNISYGKLNLQYDIYGWFSLSHNAEYYANLENKNYAAYGAVSILHEVLNTLNSTVDLSKYDSNNDKIIDSIHIIYNHPIDYSSEDSFWWAYQTFSVENRTYDGVYAQQFVFASLNFLFEDNETCNTRTYIHESGHMFGIPDYYDYDDKEGFNKGGLGGYDMMDATFGDFNPFSKMALGWIDKVFIPTFTSKKSVTYEINSFDAGGDTILLPLGTFNSNLGIFQKYYLICLNNCNSKILAGEYQYVTKNGIRVYEVNGVLDTYRDGNTSYEYFKYDNSYTEFNLINAINNTTSSFYNSYYYSTYQHQGICTTNSDFFYAATLSKKLPSDYEIKVESIDNINLKAKITIRTL